MPYKNLLSYLCMWYVVIVVRVWFLWIQWYVAVSANHASSESAHPRLMESDDVVYFSLFPFLCMSELDRAGASLNAISLSLSHFCGLAFCVVTHPAAEKMFLVHA